MDITFSEADLAFQKEVREFLTQHFTPELAARLKTEATEVEGILEWQKILAKQGWIAPSWPKQFGGTEWSITQQYIFESEYGRCGAPNVVPFGLKMVAPVLIRYGSEEQKQRFLPDIYNSDKWWCQGYSEPGAGSDLADLKTRAERVGDEYIVNGAKIWTTYAHIADWIFCLVRSDSLARKQDGISFLLIDMKSPGISVNKIESIDAHHSLNEVVFEDVRVPVANRIGEEGQGWTYAKALLAHERTAIASVALSRRHMQELRELAATETRNGKPLIEDAMVRQRLSDIDIELMALEYTELRVLSDLKGGKAPGPESSLLKIKGTEIQQAIQQLRMDLAGYYSGVLPTDQDVGHDFGCSARREYMYGRAATIYGGSNEVQKNITAKAVLGL